MRVNVWIACCAVWSYSGAAAVLKPVFVTAVRAAGGMPSGRYTVDDALNKCGTWDAFQWLMLFYCGLSWMCDVSGSGSTLHQQSLS
jgi:hypothetical protein